MANALATQDHAWTPEQVELIKRTICPGASNDELALFLYTATRTGLDPLARQIYALKRRQKNPQGVWEERLSIQVGIDGFRLVGQRSGEMDGRTGPEWCGEDGIWRDVWLSTTPPAAARVTIHRKGHTHGYTAVALFTEYAAYTSSGALTAMWRGKPALMLAKCAEALALRQAFPAELSGLYSDDEMQQASNPAELPAGQPIQPEPAQSPQPAENAPTEPARASSGNPGEPRRMAAKINSPAPCPHCGKKIQKGGALAYYPQCPMELASAIGINPDKPYAAHESCYDAFVASVLEASAPNPDDDLPF